MKIWPRPPNQRGAMEILEGILKGFQYFFKSLKLIFSQKQLLRPILTVLSIWAPFLLLATVFYYWIKYASPSVPQLILFALVASAWIIVGIIYSLKLKL